MHRLQRLAGLVGWKRSSIVLISIVALLLPVQNGHMAALAQDGSIAEDPGPVLRRGERDPLVRTLRHLLECTGHIGAGAGNRLDPDLAAATEAAQASLGLEATGEPGVATFLGLSQSCEVPQSVDFEDDVYRLTGVVGPAAPTRLAVRASAAEVLTFVVHLPERPSPPFRGGGDEVDPASPDDILTLTVRSPEGGPVVAESEQLFSATCPAHGECWTRSWRVELPEARDYLVEIESQESATFELRLIRSAAGWSGVGTPAAVPAAGLALVLSPFLPPTDTCAPTLRCKKLAIAGKDIHKSARSCLRTLWATEWLKGRSVRDWACAFVRRGKGGAADEIGVVLAGYEPRSLVRLQLYGPSSGRYRALVMTREIQTGEAGRARWVFEAPAGAEGRYSFETPTRSAPFRL